MAREEAQTPKGLGTLLEILEGARGHEEAIHLAEVQAVREVVNTTKRISQTLIDKGMVLEDVPVYLNLAAIHESIRTSPIGGRALETAKRIMGRFSQETRGRGVARLRRIHAKDTEGKLSGEFVLDDYDAKRVINGESLFQVTNEIECVTGTPFNNPWVHLILRGSINLGQHMSFEDEIKKTHSKLDQVTVMGILANAVHQAVEELPQTPQE